MSSHEPRPSDFLGDPLSDISRRERRNLVASSATAILIAHTGLVPTRISALGIELSPPAQSSFLVILGAVVAYFTAAFVIYGFSDLLVWRHKYQDYLEKVEITSQNWTQEDQVNYDELQQHVPSIAWLYRISKPAAYFRIGFEFALPLLIGLYAIYALISRA